jgi:hypothetical protein
VNQWIADTQCRVYAYAYRMAAAMHLPTDGIHVAYVNAVRRANAIYWRRWAIAHGDMNYLERNP